MARLDEVKSWMRWYGWDKASGVKRDANGRVIAHWGDAIWQRDVDEAIAIEDRLKTKFD